MAATGDLAADPPPVARSVEPDPSLTEAFDAAHARYRATYAALREIA
jgi:xylulokinase